MNHTTSGVNVFLTSLLFALEGLSLLLIFSGYRFSAVDGLANFLTSSAGILFLVATLALMGTGLLLIRHLRRLPPTSNRTTSLTLSVNAATVVLMVLAGEASLRAYHEVSMLAPQLWVEFPTLRNWEKTSADFLAAINNRAAAYHDYDPELGWTIGKNRRSQDGLYASSAEGLRSARPGDTRLTWTASRSPAVHADRKPARVALLGDSFTFGYEVSYDESWAHQLAMRMAPDFDLVNFGVIGYSVNQIRMKYERDVRPLAPDLVIVGLISSDFQRDSWIYNFLRYPDMLALPYARPRPTLRDGVLALLNMPLPRPEAIFTKSSVHELPHLQADLNYNWLEWERWPWRWLQRSLLFRTVASWPPGPPTLRATEFEREQHALHRAVLRSFAASVQASGSTLLFLYFPSESELPDTGRTGGPTAPYAARILAEMGLPYEDMSTCVRTVRPERRFAPGTHYTPEVNAALAACLPDIVRAHLNRRPPTPAVYANHR